MAPQLASSFAVTSALVSPKPGLFPPSSPKASVALNVEVDSAETTVFGVSGDASNGNQKVAVLICPAQFCVPVDYEKFVTGIMQQRRKLRDQQNSPEIASCRVAPLPRTEWIKVARNLPTRSFLESTLPVYKTLDWYFEAMEDALSDIFAEEGEDVKISIIGHSIGGWVARAYLGGLSGSSTSVHKLAQRQCKSLITLGTPHSSPDSALVDQTRGLLKEVEAAVTCSPQALADRGIDVTCVGSTSLQGKIISTNVEELVAASSYLPLLGRLGGDVTGDGIVPTDLAFMEAPARRIEVSNCKQTGNQVRHAHVLPTPWNLLDGSAASLPLPEDFAWYGSAGVLDEWVQYI